MKSLKLMWWNACNFFHFDIDKISVDRWPKSRSEYEAKCRLVDIAIGEIKDIAGEIDILCLCEISRVAVEDLRDRLFPGFNVASLDIKNNFPTLQVAIIYPPDRKVLTFSECPPITVPDAPRSTRPMAVLDVKMADKSIRIICCHWQARIDEENSEDTRYTIAKHLSKLCYDYIKNGDCDNLIIVGDLNEEPFERSLRALHAHRHRKRALAKSHPADHDVKRLHLYNPSWRYFGEQTPSVKHASYGASMLGCAGTYYRATRSTWHNFDQIIVSAGLLSRTPPFVDENEIFVVSCSTFLTKGLPIKFSYNKSKAKGLSDHLPLLVKINI